MSKIRFSSGVDVYTIMQRFMFWVRGILICSVNMIRLSITKSSRIVRIGINTKDLNLKIKMNL